MKLSTQWKTLKRDQRRTWMAWAKTNPLLLDDGNTRHVSGHKAMTLVLRNRALAGEAANPAVLPAAVTWLDGSLTTSDTGPWTAGPGYIGFRCGMGIPTAAKWFVWASAPVPATDPKPLATLKFISVLSTGPMAVNDITGNLGTAYLPVQGDWHPPVDVTQRTPHWDPPRKMWFRLHHYANGQLSPGVILSGGIDYEL
jgi:hypothetical protein